MPEVRGPTLMMAVQAVDEKIQALARRLDAAVTIGEDVTGLEDSLLSWQKAAAELKVAYEAAARMSSNLPSYASLVR